MMRHTSGRCESQTGDITVSTKTAFALAFAFATISGALAATKSRTIVPSQNVYNPRGAYVATDPGRNLRYELNDDRDRGNE
jgi:hypothetical protein